jgi:Bacterial regulatory protein, Fis family
VDEVLKLERNLISEVLAKVNGRVSYAAKLLGAGYQGPVYIMTPDTPNYSNDALRYHARGEGGQQTVSLRCGYSNQIGESTRRKSDHF